jgi:glycosyltransferase involved in cell wall biosynthesis
MSISVIIPTYNRAEALRRTLDALAVQMLPADTFDVLVVDDGSTDNTREIASQSYPFCLRYLHQGNCGATAARNFGACQSRADILVFIDDDIELFPTALADLARAVETHPRTVVLGLFHLSIPEHIGPYTAIFAASVDGTGINRERPMNDRTVPVHFSDCKTGILALRREDFIALGRFEDPTGGWPNWDDVDFGYRAHQAQFQFIRFSSLNGYHRDQTSFDLKSSCLRVERAARSAARLFQKHPDLFPHLAMFHDKTPISVRQDPPRLILHKAVHRLTAWQPVLASMEFITHGLEKMNAHPKLLGPMYRWIRSSYIYRGYRQGRAGTVSAKEML